jgi:uncharacterized protein YyaL (SSP411 family)
MSRDSVIRLLFGFAISSLSAADLKQPPLQHTNRLAGEKSPYLLQHAHNPVDWYPWGEEAFAKARREAKPIFISVGYSTCHWCHVMERESFENVEIAKIMNDHFVCIKVDREERSDVDRVYMAFVQASTGGGGWPMSVWLTPDLMPFYGGTYYPSEEKFGLPAFPKVLEQISAFWANDREKLVKQGGSFVDAMRRQATAAPTETAALDQTLLTKGYDAFAAGFDAKEGGFSRSPKFPRPVTLTFLFHTYAREGTNSKIGMRALEMATFTLRKMAAGGIHDHLGGGFHRYSVDAYWHVPHFEKMLYDQAQLSQSYLDAFQITRDPLFEQVARGVLDYVRRDLTDASGGFYSAEDADSVFEHGKPEHGEGAFYVWKAEEIERLLGKPAAEIFSFRYGVKAKGNAPDGSDPHDEFVGKNILNQHESLEATAGKFKLSPNETAKRLDESRQKLLAARAKRPRPHLDDKIITAWNGLMISAFARAHQVLDDPAYLEVATRSATFVRGNLYEAKSGGLIRSYRQGASTVKGFVDDYAFLIQGLLDLYEASFDVQWLRWAMQLQEKQDALFWDAEQGGYFSMGSEDKSIVVRMKEDHDGAEPSPNSVSALNLLRLSQMTDNAGWRKRGEKTLAFFSASLNESPQSLPQMLVALDFHLAKPRQIVIAGTPKAPDTRVMLRVTHRLFLPNRILLLADGAAGQEFLSSSVEFLKSVKPLSDKATAYVCENYVCQLPTDDPATLEKLLVGKR